MCFLSIIKALLANGHRLQRGQERGKKQEAEEEGRTRNRKLGSVLSLRDGVSEATRPEAVNTEPTTAANRSLHLQTEGKPLSKR